MMTVRRAPESSLTHITSWNTSVGCCALRKGAKTLSSPGKLVVTPAPGPLTGGEPTTFASFLLVLECDAHRTIFRARSLSPLPLSPLSPPLPLSLPSSHSRISLTSWYYFCNQSAR